LNNKTIALSCQEKNAHSTKINVGSDISAVNSCQNTKCKHHVFFEDVFEHPSNHFNGQLNHLIPNETPVSRSFFNCMLRLNRELTLHEIKEMYGVTIPTVARIIDLALRHIKNDRRVLKDLGEYYNA